MEKKNTIDKKKVAILCVIILTILIIAIYTILHLVNNQFDVFVVTNGTLEQEETVSGYVVREETVIKGKNYKNGMVKIKSEGEKVAKGDSIFRYYSSNEENIKNEIANLDAKIQQIMQNENGAFNTDIKLLESQIEKELNYTYEANSVQKIQDSKKNISSYVTKKAKISGEYSPSGSYLKTLLSQREEYEKQLNENSEYIEATDSGVVSYRVDGLEEVLQTSDFSKLNKDFLEKLNLKTGQTIASSEEMGKIINNYKCYIIFNSDSNEAKSAKQGDSIKIRLQNSETTNATVENIIEESDGSKTITIKITNDVEKLISYRKISLDIIWWSADGFRVPNEAIKEKDGLSYVVRNRNGYYNKMLVKILKQNEEYCIVRAYKTEELKELGYSTRKIYNMKNIALYDEIVLRPTEEQMAQ